MELCIPGSEPSPWAFPAWLEDHQLPDARFAKAYNALGDQRRALIKGLIARHYVLTPPNGPASSSNTRRYDLLEHTSLREPAPFMLLLLDGLLDAPALFLSALLPALCARVPQVFVARLGQRSAVPDALLASCELCGQERLAALGPMLVQRLVHECAASGEPGLVLHPDTPEFRRLLGQKELRQVLDASPLRLVPLRAPRVCAIWRDSSIDLPPEDVALLYGALSFETGGAVPGMRSRTAPDEDALTVFCEIRRDLLLAPPAHAGQHRAGLTASGECLGLWRWPELHPGLFEQERQIFLST
ncbi:MAG TPA: hypothetical protein VN419_14075 [Humidesulfovibrio sp.]|uniref:hypothetical protein n=1 Tax=Humidesulfovibrio sp. TaxID=2910988 RepID=UPI002C312ED2|nr:hypothetical protein [Humidesulfovibrio sp.]HWR05129.1 hypothetical protein [Humidesulfovibrio sp.]